MEAGSLVIPFDRPVQVAACSIVGLALISTSRARHSGTRQRRDPRNGGIHRHVSTNPVLEPLAAESLCP